MHKAHLVHIIKKANPQKINAIKDTLHTKVKITKIHNLKFKMTRLQQKKQAKKSKVKNNASKKTIECVAKNSLVAKRSMLETKLPRPKKHLSKFLR